MSKIIEFKKYFLEFYHPQNGLYPIAGLTDEEFFLALSVRLYEAREQFQGDSCDREIIRDMILSMRNT